MIPIQNLFRKKNQLEITTNVLVDDYFNGIKQARWSAALGKLLVANYSGKNIHFRNGELSFSSKRCKSSDLYEIGAVDSDANLIYLTHANTLWSVSLSISGALTNLGSVAINSIRMIDASLPNHILVTHNATDHHELLLVNKTSMAVVATLGGAAGAGDGKFNNPLGVFYYNGFAYVADASNKRVVKVAVNTVAETLTFDSNIDLSVLTGSNPVYDLFTNGENWYIIAAGTSNLYKLDMNFAALVPAQKIASDGYSLTLIPDQGDGNGATIAVCSNTNSNIKRHKCSDLSLIAAVGTSGDGSLSLFDPTFTTSVNTRITFTFDDGFQYTTPLGTSHALSWNGFAGYSFRSAGPHRCVVRVEGGLGLVTGMDCLSDSIISIKNLIKLKNLTGDLYLYTNPGFILNLADIPSSIGNGTLYLNSMTTVRGTLSQLPRWAGIVISGCTGITGQLSDIAFNYNILYADSNTAITGSLSNINAASTFTRLFGDTGITAASIAALVAIRDLRIYSMGWNAANVDTVLLSASDAVWLDPNHYTYGGAGTGPSLRIDSNAVPGGSVGADTTDPFVTPGSGNSNADWAWLNGGFVIGGCEKSTSGAGPNIFYSQKFTAFSDNLNQIRVQSLGAAHMKVALYADNAGAPGALLAYSAGAAVVAGWNTFDLNTSAALTVGTSYWLAVVSDTDGMIARATSGGTEYYKAMSYSDSFPDPAPAGGSTSTRDYAIMGIGYAHKALTGKAAVRFLTHLVNHAWAITYQLV